MAATIPVSCTRDDDGNSSKTDPSNPDFVDRNAPTITVVLASVDITGIEKIFISGSKLYISDKLVASWTDDVTKNCKVQLAFDGSSISSGDVASHS